MDRTAGSREECLALAREQATALARVPREARHATKMLMRQETYDSLADHREADLRNIEEALARPDVQETLGNYFQALRKEGKGK